MNGGDLVSILRKDENDFIARKFVELDPNLNGTEYHYPWIGAYLTKRQNPSKQLSVLLHFHLRKRKFTGTTILLTQI